MAIRLPTEHQAIEPWPRGRMTKAASRGPSDEPRLPPTWKIDWASPKRPPEESRAMRDASGWNTDDPTPTSAAAASRAGKEVALESSSRPAKVKPMPMLSA